MSLSKDYKSSINNRYSHMEVIALSSMGYDDMVIGDPTTGVFGYIEIHAQAVIIERQFALDCGFRSGMCLVLIVM
ncbi:hypothetical protein HDU92_003585 [Lobulomyces angularis]|nr:hypothetical protein HDU92_003585 [Lobulomyces angularis]